LIAQSGFFLFQAATSMSTISLLPPERSHIVSGPLVAQLVVASPAVAAGGSSVPPPQPATSRVVATASTGHL
jgi:hypothetical protein